MARRLSLLKLILGTVLATATANLQLACAQPAQQDGTTKVTSEKSAKEKDQAKNPPENGEHRAHDGDRREGDRRDGDRREGDRREGDRRGGRGFNADAIIQMMKRNPGFMQEVVKRDGGPLELLAPLMKPEVRGHLSLTADQAAAADKFLVDMTSRFEEDIKAHKDDANANWEELFSQRLKSENDKFEEFLKKDLPADKLERLIGIFVQYRNLRALGNRVVAVKVGMSIDEANKLHEDIRRIRMETIRENDESARRRFDNGNPVQQEEHLNKIRGKIDARIEKLVKKEHLDKLKTLKGEPLPTSLIEMLDRPPAPPKRTDKN